MQIRILLVLGPSGAGKTTLGNALAAAGMLHLDFDQYPKNGVDEEGLRAEWNAFFLSGQPQLLSDSVRNRAQTTNCQAAVITCPGSVYLCPDFMRSVEPHGYRFAILFGPRDACLAAFLSGPHAHLGASHWELHNARYDYFARPEFEEYRVSAFDGPNRRPIHEIVSEMQALLAA
jgi:energy-coupling factor transporter ATP-binding protein EcfA2